jgi:predicted small integral membrane protein
MGLVFSSIIALTAIVALCASGGVSAYAASKSNDCKSAKNIAIINATVCFIIAIILF